MTAPTIFANVPGSFPYSVFTERHPALIDATRRAYDYPPAIRHALDDLRAEITSGLVRPLPEDAVDAADWNARWGSDYFGRPWTDLPWLWGESYFYRRLLDAVDFFRPGAWHRVDPFAPVKHAELASGAVDDELASFDELADSSVSDRFAALIQAALWGNRADLGFNLSKPDAAGRTAVSSLVVDDTEVLWRYAEQHAPLSVGLIADNAGRELIPDLMLADLLLATGIARSITVHLKYYPYFVSDATVPDLDAALSRMRDGGGVAALAAERLDRAYRDGHFKPIAASLFCAPLPYRDQLDELRSQCGGDDLTIVKGDLNYRRLVDDRYWPATTPFRDLTDYFPSRIVALRTLKSDVVVGLRTGQAEDLDATGDDWRKSGRYAMVQARL